MNFKSQLVADMDVFHNPEEMAQTMSVIYQNTVYTVPVVLDHAEAANRMEHTDHAQGIFRVDAIAYMALKDMRTVPRKGASIEIGTDETGYVMYDIEKSTVEDGEIILELVVFDE